MTVMTHAVPASTRILRRIDSVQKQIEAAKSAGEHDKADIREQVRQAYLVDLIDVLNEEEQARPRAERRSFNLASTEAWIKNQLGSKTS